MDMTTECIVLVDTSYYLKYSANAAWRRIKDDHNLSEDENFDPMMLEEYREAYSGYFLFGLDEIVGKHFPIHSGSNFVFCMDSKRSDIWRKAIFPGYKHQRDLTKKKFSYKNIDDWTERYIKSHNVERGSRSIKVNGAEADDIFKVVIDHISSVYPHLMILIVSGDSDLLQLGGENVMQIDAHGELLTIESRLKKDKVEFDPTPLNYLRYKIMTGDTSDSIPSIKHGKCGPKKAASLVNDPEEMVRFIKSDPEISEAFIRNATLIDLSKTPKMLCESIMNQWESFNATI